MTRMTSTLLRIASMALVDTIAWGRKRTLPPASPPCAANVRFRPEADVGSLSSFFDRIADRLCYHVIVLSPGFFYNEGGFGSFRRDRSGIG